MVAMEVLNFHLQLTDLHPANSQSESCSGGDCLFVNLCEKPVAHLLGQRSTIRIQLGQLNFLVQRLEIRKKSHSTLAELNDRRMQTRCYKILRSIDEPSLSTAEGPGISL